MRMRRADQCFALLVSVIRFFTEVLRVSSLWAASYFELMKRLDTRYVQYSFILFEILSISQGWQRTVAPVQST